MGQTEIGFEEVVDLKNLLSYMTLDYTNPIQHGRERCKWLVKRIDKNIRILQQFKTNE